MSNILVEMHVSILKFCLKDNVSYVEEVVLSTLIKANGLSSFLFAGIRIIFPLKSYAHDQSVK